MAKNFLFTIFFFYHVTTVFSQSDGRNISQFPQRERTFDVLHIKIEVRFDETNKKVYGKVTSRIVPLIQNLNILELDAEDMIFQSASVNGANIIADTSFAKKVRLRLNSTFTTNDTLTYTIEYTGTPKKGLYFIAKDSTDPESPRQIWTQGESEDNHHWFPCYDSPNDKSTSEVIVTVNSDYITLSNGRLINIAEDKSRKTKTWHWYQDKPHSSYLIMFAAGDYKKIEDRYKDKVVDFYAYKSNIDDAKNSLNYTVDAIDFFSRSIGYDYPWDKYSQIILKNFMYGGMENTSATTLTETTIHDKRSEIDGVTSIGVMAHELAHQWWGDLVTTNSWSHVWLNESFATYFEALYHEHLLGRSYLEWEMISNAMTAKMFYQFQPGPIVFQTGHDVDEWPVANVYQKGSCVLHMLRWLIGDSTWWKSMNVYAHRYEYKNVETEDLRSVVEEASGKNLSTFFTQWVYKSGYPKYSVSREWNAAKKQVALRVKQTQMTDSAVGLFSMPVDIAVLTSKGKTHHQIYVTKEDETFMLSSDAEPINVEFDAPGVILKDVQYAKSQSAFIHQLQNGSSIESKNIALDSLLSSTKNQEIFAAVYSCAMHESFNKLRSSAVRGLKNFEEYLTPIQYNALLHDADAQVRVEAIRLLRNKHNDTLASRLLIVIRTDSSYACISAALNALAGMDSTSAFQESISLLSHDEQSSVIESAALNTLLKLKEKKCVPIVMRYVDPKEQFDVRYSATQILAKLGGDDPDVVQKITESLKDKSTMVRNIAARSLREIGNKSTIGILKDALKIEQNQLVKHSIEASIQQLEEKFGKN